MAHQNAGVDVESTHISYQLIRNVTSSEEKANGVTTYIANVSAHELKALGTTDNLRTYIPEHSNKRRNQVHKAIESTIAMEPERFINRNSGLTVSASDAIVDDKKARITLFNASIINGAQTQGEILRYLADYEDEDDHLIVGNFPVRVEICIDPDHSSVIETAIARNAATRVEEISTAGKRGHLDELDAVFFKETGRHIRKSETDTDVEESLHILQITRLLMPTSVSGSESDAEILKPYKNKGKCLEDFSTWYRNRKTDPKAAMRYQFVLDMAVPAFREYQMWEKHAAWNGHQIWEHTKKGRAVRRDKNKNIIWVSPGLLFPVMKALSAFVKQQDDGHWVLDKPSMFKPGEIVRYAVKAFRSADSNPMDMGRNESSYTALLTYTETLMSAIEAAQAE